MRLVPRPDRAELGDRDLPLRQHLEQERLERLVGAIDLVDEQHRRPVLRVIASSSGRLSRNFSLKICAFTLVEAGPSVSLRRARSIWRG